jgi:hypothetical protein
MSAKKMTKKERKKQFDKAWDEALDAAYQDLIAKIILTEREACAEVCKKHADVYAKLEQNPTAKSAWAACIDNRDAIRARGQA